MRDADKVQEPMLDVAARGLPAARVPLPASPWLSRPQPRPHARARLYCFPHAGVGASVYRQWHAALPPEVEVCAVQLPGRENRLGEPALTRIADIVQALVLAIEPQSNLPFAFFGHSMGAVVAFELAHALARRGSALPRHLWVSGRRPPHWPDSQPPLHRLPDAQFAAEINRRYGGIPQELLQHADVMELLLPGLRADITALETHLPPRREPLALPISVFGGAHDPLTPMEHLDGWRSETRGSFRIRVFPGDHFYLKLCAGEVWADVASTLAPLWEPAR